MKEIQELTWQQLESAYPPSDFSFKTTDDLESLDEIIGQERAKKAMEFGLNVEAQGYNIYISGQPGTGKATFAKAYTQKVATHKKDASDWCYVYNFREKRIPKALRFDTGDGRGFKDDMNELIAYLSKEICYIYQTQEYEQKKRDIANDYQKEKELYIEELKKNAKAIGFLFKILEQGISFAPLDDQGNKLTQEILEQLDIKQQMKIKNGSKLLQDMALKIITSIKEIEQISVQKLEDLQYQMGFINIGYYIKKLKEKYLRYENVLEYLDDLQQDILENIEVFIGQNEKKEQPVIRLAPWTEEDSIKKQVRKYDVNLLVDNSKGSGAPVIIGDNPAYSKIIGELEYDNEFGSLSTDYMKIKPGLFHKANGGYLILQAEEVLTNHETWGAIKQVLKTKQIAIENPRGISVMTVPTLKPEPIPVSIKVILIGSLNIYHLLYGGDSDFKKLFKVNAYFDSEMHNNTNNIQLLARFIKTISREKQLLPFSQEAVGVVLRYATRYIENQKMITTDFDCISNIIIEASTFASLGGEEVVEKKHVQLAIEQKRYRMGHYEEKLEEQILENTIMIQTTGSSIGQINALTVHDTGEYRFGHPMKITATTYKGVSGIINIEKEAKLSGPIHTKGTEVIEGYLGQIYGQRFPLSITCRICFEQSYGKIDGDSASSTELYSIISSLSGIPIKQNLAVTGSINQHGAIQPVGGITHKIEGFFKICKKRGLTGEQGVIIPKQNIEDLVLNDEVIEAIKNKTFHIYPISRIEDGLKILTGKPYEEIKEKVETKLERFNVNQNQS
ncbi:MAG TPA: AAA family ATPase [Epulopiscium sp.]|nr:AAA family ATPase [Candidatus Epulonipiscium sp.]